MTLTEWADAHGQYAVRDLARMTGVHRTTIAAILNRTSAPSVATAAAIEIATKGKVKAEELLDLEAWRKEARVDQRLRGVRL